MKLLTRLMISCWLLIAWRQLQAQSPTAELKGTVHSEQGALLRGVTVEADNTSTHEKFFAVSDELGVFHFKKIPGGKYDLNLSSVGYIPGTYKGATTGQGSLLIDLKPNRSELNEVVVTALGIKRAEKSLGFAAQTVSENAVKDAKTNNWVNSLSGKVAGLNIQGTGAGPMSSSRITLRGENSLNLDNNQALIVMDGVPISSRITGTGFNSNLAADAPVDFGSDISDINPDDIESVTVLKGPGATALYGSRAAGGALIITTKSGARKDKGLGITYNNNTSIDQINRWPD